MGCGQREAGGPRRRLAYLEAHLNSPRSVRSTAGSTAEPRPSRRQSRRPSPSSPVRHRREVSEAEARPKPPRRESKRRTRGREAATTQRHTPRETRPRREKHHKTRAGRPLNKSPLPAEPRPRRSRHLADARAEPPDLQRAARAGGRLGRVAHARVSYRRREPARRGGATREGRLLARRDAGATAGPPPEHERVYI